MPFIRRFPPLQNRPWLKTLPLHVREIPESVDIPIVDVLHTNEQHTDSLIPQIPSSSSSPFPFLALPPEIRRHIYLALLPSTTPISIHLGQVTIRTGRQVHCQDEREDWFEDEELIYQPTLAEVESTSPSEYPIFQSESPCSTTVQYPFLSQTEKQNWRTLRALAQACTTIRDEIALLLQNTDSNRVELHAEDIYQAEWYGITHTFTSSLFITHLAITKPFYSRLHFRYSQRWLTQLFLRFAHLTYLRLHHMHQHKEEEVWGSRWRMDDLKVMQFILLISKLDIVANRAADHHDKCWFDIPDKTTCRPVVEFVAERVARQYLGEFPLTVDVEEELGKALVKKKRRVHVKEKKPRTRRSRARSTLDEQIDLIW
jgi:hypothetical protein